MARWTWTLLGLALFGCTGKSDDDADGDGFAAADDCNDSNADVHPDATEACNGIDDNCDGDIDEDGATGTSSWFVDEDGDGNGAMEPVYGCDVPSGSVTTGTDCDDRNPDVHLGAEELCNGVDDNCDGDIDEDPVDALPRYPDDDGDGFGAPGAVETTCEPVDGLADNAADCDDSRADVFPGADELCNGEDDDCDGEIDENADGDTPLYADTDGDGFGDPTDTTLACGAVDGFVADATDCDDDNAAVNPDAIELCSTEGVDDNCDGVIDGSDAPDLAVWYADADGDGHGDSSLSLDACAAPAGYAALDDDCDDDEPTTYPGAPELCNGLDDDCDGSVNEDGTAVFIAADGTVSDWTSVLTGTSRTPAAVSLTDDGTLRLCDGTWYVNLDIAADVVIQSSSGATSAVVLDGADAGPVLEVQTDGVTLEVADLTLTGGAGSDLLFGAGYAAGGGLACYAPTLATVTLDSVLITGNEAAYGGGIVSYGCSLDLTDTDLDTNTTSIMGGAAAIFGGELVMEGGVVTGNTSDGDGAGLVYYAADALTVSGSLLDVDVSDNFTDGVSGGLIVYDATVDVSGPRGSGFGFNSNTDTVGGVYVGGAGLVTFDRVDFGTVAAGDNNDPADIYCETTAYAYLYDDDESFECDASTCGSETSYTLGAGAYSQAVTTGAVGNTLIATTNGTIDSFELYMSSDAACSGSFYVLSSTSTSARWDVEWSGTVTAPAGRGFVSSGNVGVPVVPGQYYALVEGLECGGTDFYYTSSGAVANDVGMGTTNGIWYDTAYDPLNYVTSVATDYLNVPSRIYMNVAISH